jgi:hypothetical protein
MTLHQKSRWLWTESGGNDNTPSKNPAWYSLGVVATMTQQKTRWLLTGSVGNDDTPSKKPADY